MAAGLALAAAVLAAAAGAPQEPARPSPEPPRFSAQVHVITVDVVVVDKKGRAVPGLTLADFELREDGVAQEIATFDAVQIAEPREGGPAAPRGRTLVIVVDDVHLSPNVATRARQAVASFLRGDGQEGDLVTLVSTARGTGVRGRLPDGQPELDRFLAGLVGVLPSDVAPERISEREAQRLHLHRDPEVMARVKRRFQALGASLPSVGPRGEARTNVIDPLEMEILSRAGEVYDSTRRRSLATLGVLQRCLDSLSGALARKSVVLVSEGFSLDTSLPGFREVVQSSFRANAALYFLDARGLLGASTYQGAEFSAALDPEDLSAAAFETMDAAEGAEHIALESGGLIVRGRNDLDHAFRDIAEEARAYYLLGYTPRNDRADGRFRRIEVRVSRKGLKARARKGYFAPRRLEEPR